MASSIRPIAVALGAAALLATSGASALAADSPPGQVAKLRKAVTTEGMMRHAQAFQTIATANGGTRASGTAGYNASVDYVVSKLEDAGYDPVVQPFDFAFFQELAAPTLAQTAPNAKTYVQGTDFEGMTYSGSGNVTAAVQEAGGNQFPPGPTPSSSAAGCEASDFAGFTAGNIALIQRGTCTFGTKAANAQAAGASAVLIFNEGQPGRTGAIAGTLGAPNYTIPVLGTSFAFGQEVHDLLAGGPVTMHVTASTISETRETYNVLADTDRGDPDNVVVQGSHLDSVIEGPGIQDNGTGSAYNLESAIQMAEQNIRPRNKVRFAWWGAEELNLIGSTFYVDSLSDAEFAKIELNLNHDMIASPNFVRFVYDGDGSDTPTAGPPGSAQIEQVFLRYFDSQGLATEPTAFDGRSDYGPFIARGAPAGGLFSGAEGIKTAEQQAIYGGVAGEPYDRCYHQACDTISNVNATSFGQLGDGAAHALATYALTNKPVTATAARKVSRRTAKARMARATFRGSQAQR